MENNIYGVLSGADKKNDFSAIQLTLASPEKIRTWSYGEVRVPETINYRTFRPEPGGLCCAKIFGPQKDFECLCGKYKRLKSRGVVCEKCGVEVTLSRVRRERMGHINLACPVAHILFFKALPSRVGLVLDLTMRDIERILYFEAYVVIDPDRVEELERGQLLRVEEYQRFEREHPGGFRAGIGAEGVRDFLREIDLETESEILRNELKKAASDTRRKKIFKRLKIIESFQHAELRPEWMVLEVLPVLPADLRPLLPLESGRFTTSDLNDLYRRVINRNNRLKRLIDLGAPEVIINNEKRMLQEAVDSLLDNGRRGKPATGANRRPLKSVVDIIKGKSGRFRQNLLGKRVDFSGRSVIVVGPDLKLHQCGLPKQMALTLFRPFVFGKLIEQGAASNVKNARVMVESEAPEVWGALEEVISQHPVLLNRAPTLHRLGVQAFEPVLTEGKAIQLHPLVCVAFNADFDGDQMAVHVPLSLEAQAEARVLMLSSNNILAPANGEPIIVPTQDVVLGLYYATRERPDAPGNGMRFSDVSEVERALAAGVITLQTPIEVRLENDMAAHTADEQADGTPSMRLIKTTAGRALIKRFLPVRMPFSSVNRTMKKRDIIRLIKETFQCCGHRDTVIFCDKLMRFGFEKATRAGISVCMDDMIIPAEKADIITETEDKIRETHDQFLNGLLTEDERYNKSVDYWDKAGERVSQVMMKNISSEQALDGDGNLMKGKDGKPVERESFNSIYMMADSGARGSETQIKQLAGMRGLMTKPDGRIMENAITANFREGLSVLQYFISTHGARKGLSDTALKTANSGYLTRRLVDVTQDIVIAETDCGSTESIVLRPAVKDGNETASLAERILGRTLAEDIVHPQSGHKIYERDEYIDEQKAQIIAEAGVDEAKVRSPVTCHARYGLCAKCYGRDLGRGGKVQIGEAVGVVAAQSIGEPGTQLTMRTFHIGGAASREVVADNINARNSGKLRLNAARYVMNMEGDLVIVSRGGEMSVQEANGRERERYRLQYGQVIKAKDGEDVKAGQILSQRDPMARPIIAEYEGTAKLENIEMGVNAREQTDDMTGLSMVTITENKQGSKKAKQPQLKFVDAKDMEVKIPGTETPVTIALLPGAILPSKVCAGEKIAVGDVIAKMPQKAAKSRDITGGLPRVAELFEAREPKEPALLANASGRVSLRGMQRGKQALAILNDDKKEACHVPRIARLTIKDDSEIRAEDVIAVIRAGIDGSASRSGGAELKDELKITITGVDDKGKEKQEQHRVPSHFKIKIKSGAQVKKGDVLAEVHAKIGGLLQIRESANQDAGNPVSDMRNQLINLCPPDKAPVYFKKWAQNFIDKTAKAPDDADRLLSLVARAELDLEKAMNSVVEKNPQRKKLVTSMKRWYNGFIQRSHPDKWKGAPSALQKWAKETNQTLVANKESTSKNPDYDVFRDSVTQAATQLESLTEEKKYKTKLNDWRNKIGSIDDEYKATPAPEADPGAAQYELNIQTGLEEISAKLEIEKAIGGEKTVEIISATFHTVPKGRTILVQDGSRVSKGEEIVDGDSNPHEILAMRGVGALVEHIVGEVQDVYRLQGVNINDKHIEVIIHQMLRCRTVTKSGDSYLIPGDQVMHHELEEINAKLEKKGKAPAKARTMLLGITKASLATDSFISAASFQETSRVLTEAAVAGRRDRLRGLKENVIVGRLVPTGTGFVHYQKMREHTAQMEAENIMRDQLQVQENQNAAVAAAKESDDSSAAG